MFLVAGELWPRVLYLFFFIISSWKTICTGGSSPGLIWGRPAHMATCRWLLQGGKGKHLGGKENTGTEHNDAVPSRRDRPPIPRSQVQLPLEPGSLVECKWRDGKYHSARVIASRVLVDGLPPKGPVTEGTQGVEYQHYVHYRKLNRRMDEWVQLENVNLETVVPPEPLDPSDPK